MLCVILTALALVGCVAGGDDDSGATPAGASLTEATSTPAPLSGLPELGTIVWTTTIDPLSGAPAATIASGSVMDETIYAALLAEKVPAGTDLQADWFFNDTSLDGLSTTLHVDHDRSSGWIEFHLERQTTEPWPDGIYRIVVRAGEVVIQESELQVSERQT